MPGATDPMAAENSARSSSERMSNSTFFLEVDVTIDTVGRSRPSEFTLDDRNRLLREDDAAAPPLARPNSSAVISAKARMKELDLPGRGDCALVGTICSERLGLSITRR